MPRSKGAAVNAGDFLYASERFDDASVAARTDHDKPAIAEPKAGRVLVAVLIGQQFAGKLLGRGIVVRIWPLSQRRPRDFRYGSLGSRAAPALSPDFP
jgi:hypothetical protein